MAETTDSLKVITYQQTNTNAGRQLNENVINNNVTNIIKKKFTLRTKILISVGVIFITCIGLGIGLYYILRDKKPPPKEPTDIPTGPEIDINKLPAHIKANGPLENQEEYQIKTEVNDLKRIFINQKYNEYIKVDGFLTENIIDRKTAYDIYVLEKNVAPDEARYFYNYTYLCAITISSECISSKDEYCIPKKLFDLNDQDISSSRNLQEIDNLENYHIPLCFFNLTNNNVIN